MSWVGRCACTRRINFNQAHRNLTLLALRLLDREPNVAPLASPENAGLYGDLHHDTSCSGGGVARSGLNQLDTLQFQSLKTKT